MQDNSRARCEQTSYGRIGLKSWPEEENEERLQLIEDLRIRQRTRENLLLGGLKTIRKKTID